MVKTTVMFISVCTSTERLCGSMGATQKYCFCFGRLFLTLDLALSTSLRLIVSPTLCCLINVHDTKRTYDSESDEWAGGSLMCESKKQCSRLIESKVGILVRRSALCIMFYYLLLHIVFIYLRSNRADHFRCMFSYRLRGLGHGCEAQSRCHGPHRPLSDILAFDYGYMFIREVNWICTACPSLCGMPDLSAVTQRKIRVVNLHAIDMPNTHSPSNFAPSKFACIIN